MDKMVTGGLESEDSNDGGDNGSSLVATTILHPMVRALAYSVSNKAQDRVLKQAAALTQQSKQHQRNNPHVYPLINLTSAIFKAIFKSFVKAKLDTYRRAIFGAFVEHLRPGTRPKIAH
jgi:hypothetical protein